MLTGSPGLERAIENAGLSGSPLLLRLAANVGRRLAEGGDVQGLMEAANTPANMQAGKDIQHELDGLMRLVNTDFEKYKLPETQQRIDQLNRSLVGDGLAVGHMGRTA